jgi:hypothetical protein
MLLNRELGGTWQGQSIPGIALLASLVFVPGAAAFQYRCLILPVGSSISETCLPSLTAFAVMRGYALRREVDVAHLLVAFPLQRPLDILLGGQLGVDEQRNPPVRAAARMNARDALAMEDGMFSSLGFGFYRRIADKPCECSSSTLISGTLGPGRGFESFCYNCIKPSWTRYS